MVEIDPVPLSRVTGGWSAALGAKDTPACKAAMAKLQQATEAYHRGADNDLLHPERYERMNEQTGEAAKAAVDACGGSFTPTQPSSRLRAI